MSSLLLRTTLSIKLSSNLSGVRYLWLSFHIYPCKAKKAPYFACTWASARAPSKSNCSHSTANLQPLNDCCLAAADHGSVQFKCSPQFLLNSVGCLRFDRSLAAKRLPFKCKPNLSRFVELPFSYGIARVPVPSPFYLFSCGGSQM